MIEDAAAHLGVRPQLIIDAEEESPTTPITIYVGLLWLYNMHTQLHSVADPQADDEANVLESAAQPVNQTNPAEPNGACVDRRIGLSLLSDVASALGMLPSGGPGPARPGSSFLEPFSLFEVRLCVFNFWPLLGHPS
jgi:hypothetical protein